MKKRNLLTLSIIVITLNIIMFHQKYILLRAYIKFSFYLRFFRFHKVGLQGECCDAEQMEVFLLVVAVVVARFVFNICVENRV